MHAAEIHSNGTGGGPWSQNATWHGGKVPTSNDTAVIAMRDSVVFDRAGTEEPSCADLLVDPEGVLSFKKMPGRLVLTVRGTIRTYGIIRLDATGAEAGIQELRIMPRDGARPEVILLENGALMAYGREAEGTNAARNVVVAGPPNVQIIGNDKCSIDFQNAAVTGLTVRAYNLDNTGNKPNERINFIGCTFSGTAKIFLHSCDTPAVRNNVFVTTYKAADHSAVYIVYCSLAQVSGNKFRGSYERAIQSEYDTDSTFSGNTIEDAVYGIYWANGKQAMIKHNRVSRSTWGVFLLTTSGVVEDTVVDSARTAFAMAALNMQLTDCRVENAGTNCVLQMENSSVTLLNCSIADDQIKATGTPPGQDFAENMQYVVAKLNGTVPANTQVEMQTAQVSGGVPAGKADLNVRNSPARAGVDGWTPMPRSMRALTVRSWRLGRDGKVVRAPFYDLVASVLEPGKPARELKRQLVEPQDKWYRADPNERVATVEISL